MWKPEEQVLQEIHAACEEEPATLRSPPSAPHTDRPIQVKVLDTFDGWEWLPH